MHQPVLHHCRVRVRVALADDITDWQAGALFHMVGLLTKPFLQHHPQMQGMHAHMTIMWVVAMSTSGLISYTITGDEVTHIICNTCAKA